MKRILLFIALILFSVPDLASQNLVTNGDFTGGNTGFVSDYTYAAVNTPAPGLYGVVTDPSSWYVNFPACTDHTTGTGNMMVFDGATVGFAHRVWNQVIPVTANTNYTFSYWVQSFSTSSPASLQTTINGVAVGAIVSAPATITCGNWQRITAIWNSGASTSADIVIHNNTTQTIGNDFGIDDISLTPITALVSGTVTVCKDSPVPSVTFSSNVGTSPVTFNYNINGTGSYTATTAPGSATTSVAMLSTATVGTFNYNLVSVTYAGNTVPVLSTATITVAPLPTASMFGNTTILPGESATLTFYGTPGATVAFTSTLGPNSIVIGANGIGTYNIPYIAVTTVFNLVSVTSPASGSTPSCSKPLTGNVTVTVNTNTCAIPLVEVTIDAPSPVCNLGECTDLLAHFSNIGSTTDYVVSPIPYCPSFPFTGGTTINATGDDRWSPLVNLPFNFNFYGNCYNQVLVGTNGLITFDLVNQAPLGGCAWAYTATVPNPAFPIRNAIYGVYQDTDISLGAIGDDAIPDAVQNVNYYVLDTGPNAAPNRVFVANFNQLPQFQCHASVGPPGDVVQTSQIVIHETTNIIEVFVNNRVPCLTWNSGSGLIGVQNQAGNLATTPPGRNTGTWSASNEAWRFYPKNIPAIPTEIRWLENGSLIPGSVNVNPLNVCPTGPTNYTAVVKYTNCGISEVSETINVNVAPPLPAATPQNITICSSAAPPYTVDIDQTAYILNPIPVPNQTDYSIKFYETQTSAENDDSTNITNLTNFTFSGPLPKTIYVRIEDLVTTGCFNIRPFTINIGSPSGTISYPATPYCHNIATPQPITETALSTGGTYSAVSVPPGLNLTINPTTGAITPSTSDIGTFTVTYTIPAAPPCPAYSTSTTVVIVGCGCTATASSASETLCIGTPLPAPITYTTTNAVSAVISAGALPPGTSGAFAAGVYTVTGTPNTAGTYNYTVKLTDNNGLDCQASTTIVVNPNATIALTSPATTANQTVCINAPITNIVYTVANGATGVNVSGLPTGVTGSFIPATGVYTISGSPSVAGTFGYTVTTTGGCSSATLNGTIIVNPNATISLTSLPATANQTVCISTPITNIVYAIATGATGATVLGLPAGIVGNLTGTNFTISGTPSVAGTHNYTVTTTGGCGTATLSGTITVTPNVTIALTSAPTTAAQTVCINAPITNIVYTTTNGATGATVTGLPTGVSGTFAGTDFTISGTPSVAGTFNYTVTTTGGCSTDSESGTIIVNPDATITLTSPVATTNQTVCINTAIANITYTVANGGTGATVSGLPTGVTGAFAGTTFTISGSPSLAGTFNYTVTTTGGCSTDSETGTIIVNPNATIALTSAAATAAQTVCVAQAITQIEYTIANGGTGATVTGLPTGITGSYAAGIFTINGSTALTGTFNYTVTTTGGCSTDSESGTIIINPDVTIALTSAPATAAQTLCVNTPITNIVYTTANGATGATVTGLPTGVTGTFAAGVFTISGSPSVDGTFNYTVTTTGGCASDSESGTIIVNPAVTIALTSAPGSEAQVVCINTPIAPIAYTVGNGATGATVLGLPTGVTGTFAAGVFTINGTPSVAGTHNYTVTTTGGCGTATLSGTITVNPDVTIALTSPALSDAQTVCINTPIINIVYTTANGVTGATVTGLPAGVTDTFTGTTLTISGSPSVAGTFNYNITTTGGCNVATATGSITVNPNAIITQTSPIGTESQTLCINTAITNITYAIANGGTGATATGLPTGVTGTYAGGIFTISGTPTVDGTFNITISTTGGCSSASLTATILVNPNATIALTSAPLTDAQTVCLSTPITPIEYTIANGATGATVTGLPSGMTGVFSGGVFTITGSSATTGTVNYTVTTSGGCSTASLGGTITVSPDVTIALTSAPATAAQTLCINTPITNIVYTTTNGATGAITTGLPTGVTGTFAAGVYTLSGSPSIAGTFNYIITTTGGCGLSSASGSITVNPNATIALTSLPATAAQNICINTAIDPIEYTVADGATGASAIGLPTGVTGTFAGSVFTITGTPSVAGTFNYTVTTSGGCSTASLSGTIIVRPNVTIALNSLPATAAQTVCVNTGITPITYLITNAGTAGATVTGLPAGIVTAYNAATGIFTISGTPSVAGPFGYTITTSGGCSSAFLTGSINVNPNATMVLTSAASTTNQTACIAQAITPVVFTVGSGATSASITAGALPPGMTGTFAGSTFTISGASSAAGTYNYAVTTSGGCSSVTLTGVIVVSPNVTLVLTSAPGTTNQVGLCMNAQIDPITYVAANGVTSVTVTGLPPGVTPNFVASTGLLTISGASTAVGTFNYSVTTVGGCSSASLNGSIKINPNATIALSSAIGTDAQQVCVTQEAITDITYLVANGATGASIISGVLPSGVIGNFNAATLTFTLTGTPMESGSFNYTIRTSGGCSTATISGTIVVHALPVITLPQGFICVDQAGNPLPSSNYLLTTGLSATTHTFEWTDSTNTIVGTGASYLAIAPGVYAVKATQTATGCYSSASTTVITSFPPQIVVATASSYFAEDQTVTVSVLPVGNYEYQVDGGAWQDSNQFMNLLSGYHTVTVRDKVGCGELSDTIRLIDYPKFFTPNNDGYNDTWNILDLRDQDAAKIEIYDRYGKLLKEISPKGDGWDGSMNGHQLPSTDYWFKVYYIEDTVSKTFKSHFSLKR